MLLFNLLFILVVILIAIVCLIGYAIWQRHFDWKRFGVVLFFVALGAAAFIGFAMTLSNFSGM